MTEHERLHRDCKTLAVAELCLRRGREKVAGAGGDPFWGPLLGQFALALIALERRLDEAAEDLRDVAAATAALAEPGSISLEDPKRTLDTPEGESP